MIRCLVGCLALIFAALGCRAQPVQVTVSGRVWDAADDLPLVGASVFVAGTTIGTATGRDGGFSFTAALPRQFDLVVSMVGFETQIRAISSPEALAQPILFELAEDEMVLGEVVVSDALDPRWHQRLERFVALLFSNTRNAGHIEILNPEVLSFDEVNGTLVAQAAAPLQIENHALGYAIAYHMERFEGRGDQVLWGGKTFFSDLTPARRRDAARWTKERGRAFEGSLPHFLRSLASDRLAVDGYALYWVSEPGIIKWTQPLSEEEIVELLSARAHPDERNLFFSGVLLVSYTGEDEEQGYVEYRVGDDSPVRAGFRRRRGEGQPIRSQQLSWLVLNDGPVVVDTWGNLYDGFKLTRYGYWSWERLADLLPWNFDP